MENIPSDLHESLWRRQPSATERQELRTRPELELEARLTAALVKMPDAPVPSNFTARLLAELDREETQTARSHRSWKWSFLLPRVAIATAVMLLVGLSVQQYQINSHRTALAKNVAQLATSNPLPSVDALENLDAIQRMSQSTHADGELLADLQ